MEGPVIGEANGFPLIECTVNLEALAIGSGRATWEDATFVLTAASGPSSPADTVRLVMGDVATLWSAAEIGAGETQRTGFQAGGDFPFEGVVTFGYRSSAATGVRTTEVDFDCGTRTSSTASPPVISAASATPNSGFIVFGQALDVSYTVESPVGLWQTAITLSGGCESRLSRSERFVTTATRRVAVPLPASCRSGERIRITVHAYDAGLRSATHEIPSQIVLAGAGVRPSETVARDPN